MSSMTIKQGDTLSLDALVADSGGTPINLTSYTLTSTVRSPDGSSTSLTVTKANQGTSPGVFTMSTTGTVTADWETGRHVCDVKLVVSSTVTHSDTFEIIVTEAITT